MILFIFLILIFTYAICATMAIQHNPEKNFKCNKHDWELTFFLNYKCKTCGEIRESGSIFN